MKVEELDSVSLNYWTAKAAGVSFKIDPVDDSPIIKTETGWASYNPVVNWSQCGPLIERFDISIGTRPMGPPWEATFIFDNDISGGANEPKTAICRAVVASVYGEEVPDD